MTEHTRNQNDRQGPGTGAGSRRQEQQTLGDAMQPGSDIRAAQQQQQQGGVYRPEGDRAVEFEPDDGSDITFDADRQADSQPQQENGHPSQADEGGRGSTDTGSRGEDR